MMQPYGRDTFHDWGAFGPYGFENGGAEFFAQMMAFMAMMTFVALILTAFQVWLFYRIFSKAGYNGWWSLLSLIPGVGMLVVLLILAFDRWPISVGEGEAPLPAGQPAVAPNPFAPDTTTVSQPVVPPVSPEPPIPPAAQEIRPSEPPVPPAAEANAQGDREDGSA